MGNACYVSMWTSHIVVSVYQRWGLTRRLASGRRTHAAVVVPSEVVEVPRRALEHVQKNDRSDAVLAERRVSSERQ